MPGDDTVYWCNVFEIPRMDKEHHVVKVIICGSVVMRLMCGVKRTSDVIDHYLTQVAFGGLLGLRRNNGIHQQ